MNGFNSREDIKIIYRATFVIHSKNTRVKPDPERVQTSSRVNDDPEISQSDAEYDQELGQSDPIICQVCGKRTDFRVIVDPEWSMAPMDPFRVKFDPGVFRVSIGFNETYSYESLPDFNTTQNTLHFTHTSDKTRRLNISTNPNILI